MTQVAAKLPDSVQTRPHPRLDELVRRHLRHPNQSPVAGHTRRAFSALVDDPRLDGRPLILDSGCGNGRSSHQLARAHGQMLVIGVDRSAQRLSTRPAGPTPNNVILLRAELAGFWRLAREAGWRLAYHVLYHPNPWPKPAQLGRRWHAHAAFPDLLSLGGALELRCNWRVYAQEFVQALQIAGVDAAMQMAPITAPVSAFERKYREAGHTIWQVCAELDRLEPRLRIPSRDASGVVTVTRSCAATPCLPEGKSGRGATYATRSRVP